MKKTIIRAIDAADYLFSYMAYTLSGKRIITETARQAMIRNSARQRRRIEEMQKELDRIHRELRGWTANSNRMESIKADTDRDNALKEEINSTLSRRGFKCQYI